MPTNASEQFPLWAWFVFGAALLALVSVDLILHRGARGRSRGAAITWSAAWIAVGLGFAFVVWGVLGGQRAGEYVAAYFVEKSLSVDNLFVFLVIFRALEIPHDNQRSVLSWGILGALGFRLAFVLVGVAAIEHYRWVVYIFAAVLAWAAVRMVREDVAERRTAGSRAGWRVTSPSLRRFTGTHSSRHRSGAAWSRRSSSRSLPSS